MIIDTSSREEMMQGVCTYFGLSEKVFSSFLSDARRKSLIKDFDIDVFNDIINRFIDENTKNVSIDKIFFYHLSRRLNSSTDNYTGKNLYELLSTENEVTFFLRSYDIEFIPKNGRLNLVYRGKILRLANPTCNCALYLKTRLGYNESNIDYCFNGFAFKDLLLKNDYTQRLYNAPEFITALADVFRRPEIETDYFKKSKFYCFTYCPPLNEVMFDDAESLSLEGKQKYLLNRILWRLSNYYIYESHYMDDNDNPIIRLKDNATMSKAFFVSCEEITKNMIWG